MNHNFLCLSQFLPPKIRRNGTNAIKELNSRFSLQSPNIRNLRKQAITCIQEWTSHKRPGFPIKN
ncbi:hypothetical protein DLM78_08695 [Leptospira stimsonii]|uniref:Uncharacterized protein n=1 Tax=Leptospira stimsonii TaxID=2202203 RepID=A0A8B6RYC4_9LEPT|nr:hypothetical protein DLM78_08695 [Leptospira stimsonii]